MYQKQRLKHSPNLNTILMVEEALMNMDGSVITIARLKEILPRKVNHNILKIILEYLDNSNKIMIGIRGITWIFNDNSKLMQELKKGRKI